MKWLISILATILAFGPVQPLWGQQDSASYDQAQHLYATNQVQEALTELLVLLQRDDLAPSVAGEANLLAGQILAENHLPEKALEFLQKSEAYPINDPQRQAEHAKITGDQYLQLSQPENARHYYRNLAGIQPLEADRQMVAYQKIAQSFIGLGSSVSDSVLHYNRKILKLARESGNDVARIKAHNNLGYYFHTQGQYDKALQEFDWSEKLAQESKADAMLGSILENQAIVLNNKGQQGKAIKKLKQARKIIFSSGTTADQIDYYNLMAGFYYKVEDLYQSELYNDSALAITNQLSPPESRMKAFRMRAQLANSYSDFKAENRYLQQYNSLKDSLANAMFQQEQLTLLNAQQLERQLGSVKEQLANERQARELALQRALIAEKDKEVERQARLTAEANQRDAQKAQLVAEQREELTAALLAQAESDRKLAFQERELLAQQRLQDSISTQLKLEKQNQQIAEQEALLAQQRAENAEKEVALETSRVQRLFGFTILMLILLLVTLGSLFYIRRANRTLKARNEEIRKNRQLIAAEKAKSDQLLLNILPVKIADELKSNGSAAPQHYEHVSILFADIKGFTNIAEKLPADQLVDQLDHHFRKFDEIVERHGLEKIKTIGDAYMCAGGIPEVNGTNAVDAVAAAMEMIAFMEESKTNGGIANTGHHWDLRIGVHTGPVVAGVVGKNKFAYDIWGDAVNTASRMESSGQPGKVNISENTYQLVKNRFHCGFRGKIPAKNKGEIAMYFVEREAG
ncbi:MAG: adenylate/guanylate cyclase domain-containing protein [Salibacteraceae bacterium]